MRQKINKIGRDLNKNDPSDNMFIVHFPENRTQGTEYSYYSINIIYAFRKYVSWIFV